jgi:hypothetical protein
MMEQATSTAFERLYQESAASKSWGDTSSSQTSFAMPQFPSKLHEMLDEAEKNGFHHAVGWLPGGKSFGIHDPDALVPILKLYFKQTKYKSFLRQLQNYGFHRVVRGPKQGICSHEFFVKGRRSLCLKMKRKSKFKASLDKEAVALPAQSHSSPGLAPRKPDALRTSEMKNTIFGLSNNNSVISKPDDACFSTLLNCELWVHEIESGFLSQTNSHLSEVKSVLPSLEQTFLPNIALPTGQETVSCVQSEQVKSLTPDQMASFLMGCSEDPLSSFAIDCSEDLNEGIFEGKRFFAI